MRKILLATALIASALTGRAEAATLITYELQGQATVHQASKTVLQDITVSLALLGDAPRCGADFYQCTLATSSITSQIGDFFDPDWRMLILKFDGDLSGALPADSLAFKSGAFWSSKLATSEIVEATFTGLTVSSKTVATSDVAQSYLSFSLGRVIAVVPEPSTWALMMTGLGMVGSMLRRRERVQGRLAVSAR